MSWFKFVKKGKILREEGAKPKLHEIVTAKALISIDDVIFLKEIKLPGVNTPDIVWLGFRWEIKAPKGKGKYTIQNDIDNAVKQSHNIVIDLFRFPLPEIVAINRIKNELQKRKNIQKLCYITKNREIIVLK